ncbi:hypothetical protein FNV43_RR20767 [Rhamnella rubrinervis]|uniref:Dof zinc finger protein n=1 Tax=Rhamnella rubrinervis TaxID=2594499 RepID=A0A8K0GUH4_9ROSA|nr:hypothetical protein FNV43_RR20767 [Rhamnella rubrinervis]
MRSRSVASPGPVMSDYSDIAVAAQHMYSTNQGVLWSFQISGKGRGDCAQGHKLIEMQDIHSIGGGRFFGGGTGGDRRMRPHHHQNHQALKCPRCDSLNTKFCYYNNYNLSQPRHFCKSCRRYWTKGGVLRNVPVGGGCRKTKRSKPKAASAAVAATTTSPPSPSPPPALDRKSNSHSSSESSSLTANNTTNATATTEAVSAPSTSSASNLMNIQESKFFVSNPSFETTLLEQGSNSDCGIFSEIGSFTSLITSSTETAMPFGYSNISVNSVSPFRLNQGQDNHQVQQNHSQWHLQPNQKMMSMSDHQDLKMQEITHGGGLIDNTAHVELSILQNRSNGGGFGSLGDWQPSGDHQGLFDLPNTVDQAYWSQSQWTDQDHPSLYLP